MALNFKSVFCQEFGIAPEDYEHGLFRRGFYFHAWLLAPILRRMNPEFFREDLAIVRDLADMTNPEIVEGELSFFHGRNVRDQNWLRRTFLLRLSVARLRRICLPVCKQMKAAASASLTSSGPKSAPDGARGSALCRN